MPNNNLFNTPPVIRVFLSSTFADMDKERSYFNEVIAPKISRMCSDRGVSFFSVDLRWGITKEEQIDGKVLPICLSEIDKCRPYFIGIIGNRYGSILENVPEKISQSIPWLNGKEGNSITEIEMLYAVLDHSRDSSANNSAFYIRSEKLSRELYGDLKSEDSAAISRLNELKSRIAEDENTLSADYDSIEEFGDIVMRDLVNWLDINFPKSEDVTEVRRRWYNSELLRNYIDSSEATNFINSYLSESRKPLLIYGDGARGKTTFLTAWQPLNSQKILVNCGADDSCSYWPSIARQIVNSLKEYDETLGKPDTPLGASAMYHVKDYAYKNGVVEKEKLSSDFYFVTDSELEDFRVAFIKWIRELKLKDNFTIVINDLNLLGDVKSRSLSWLPSSLPDNMSLVCTTNDDDMVQTAELLGWNVKEMPLFEKAGAKRLVNEYLHSYGKNLSDAQIDKLMASVAIKYPGQLRFLVMFLINYGRFENLDTLIEDISNISKIGDIYRYVYTCLVKEYSPQEIKTMRIVLGLVRCCNISLTERECFDLSQKVNPCTAIEWSHLCRFFEQFDIIKGDYWNIRNEEVQKFVDSLLSEEEYRLSCLLLGDHFFEKLKTDNEKSRLQNIKDNTAYAKESLVHYQNSKDWDKLVRVLSDGQVLYHLSKLDWYYVQSAWVKIFLYSDFNISDHLLDLIKKHWNDDENDKSVALMLSALLKSMGFNSRLDELYEIIGNDQVIYTDKDRDFAKSLSNKFIPIYSEMHKMKKKRDFRALHKYSTEILADEKDFNDADLCQILFFKADAEEQLYLVDECIKTANRYYLTALKAGLSYEMNRALSMRGNALFRCSQVQDALIVQQKVAHISLYEGNLREYLAAQNIIGICYYRMGDYDKSIAVFDKLIAYWEKLSNLYEKGSIVLNRCNALYLSGDIEKALHSAEEFYSQIEDDAELRRVSSALLGNMGHYADELDLSDRAEEYLLRAFEHSKDLGQESTLVKCYKSLTEHYMRTENFIKTVNYSKEEMEFLWSRGDYSSVIKTLNKTVSFLLRHRYVAQANKLEKYWKEKFSTVDGGEKYFEQQVNEHALDDVKIDKLKEAIIIAKSEGNSEREAELHFETAQILQLSDKDEATEHLLDAALLYKKSEKTEKNYECIEHAIVLQFEQGKVRNDALCKKLLEHAENESINKIVDLWKRLGNGEEENQEAKKIEQFSSKKSSSGFYEITCDLLGEVSEFESLVASCLADVSHQLVYSCSAEEMIEIVNKMPASQKKSVIYALITVISENSETDLAVIMRDYLSPQSVEKIEFYEKCIVFLKHFEGANLAAISGNLALVFRRRKEKEKTLYYHLISIDAYKKAEKKRDYLIEMMNMATAYYEFGEIEKALDLLREGLKEATLNKENQLAASIAGNIASMLTKHGKEENNDEIFSCFEIEENFFRQVGNARDLAISLLNQLIYIHNKVDQSIWQPKLSEVSAIVKENNFKEFMSVLSKLEWIASKDKHTSDEQGEDSVRNKFEKLLSAKEDYSLKKITLDKGHYHIVCYPEEKQTMGNEQIHIIYDNNSPCGFHLYCLYQPIIDKKENIAEAKKYIDWWNSTKNYSLEFDELKNLLQTKVPLVAPDWEELEKIFNSFLEFWKADKMNVQSLALGILDLPTCQGVKLNVINSDE